MSSTFVFTELGSLISHTKYLLAIVHDLNQFFQENKYATSSVNMSQYQSIGRVCTDPQVCQNGHLRLFISNRLVVIFVIS